MRCLKPKCQGPASPNAAALVPGDLGGLCADDVAGFWVSEEGRAALVAVRDAARNYKRRLMGVKRAS